MVDTSMATDPTLNAAFQQAGIEDEQMPQQRQPMYKMVGESKVPVAKSAGKVWLGRRDQAVAKRRHSGVEESWNEALRYYHHDQMDHRRDGRDGDVGNKAVGRRLNERLSETENVVFANTNALVPMLYTQNPTAEFTANDPMNDRFATVLERLVNGVIAKKGSPGIDLKPKVRRAIVMATLTNRAYVEVGYTFRQQATEQVLADLQEASQQLENAQNDREVREAEGKLMALDRITNLVQPEGPWAKFRRPHEVLIDPDAVDDGLSDANWVMVSDMMPTEYLRAVYGREDEDRNTTVSVYEPTHVLKIGKTTPHGTDDDPSMFSLIGDHDDAQANGYDDEHAYRDACRTKVWTVWDKTTRRVYMYNDGDWTWPIWVWDDPYRLETFFPIVPLSFFTNPDGGEGKGEVTYYLDQQDAINEMVDEQRRARMWARRNILFNKAYVDRDQVERMLKGPDGSAVGVDLPEGVNMQDIIFSMVPPSMQFTQLFDPASKLAAIDRISSVNDVMRGAQFRTNTTNEAIETYGQTQSARLEEKQDAVEDFISGIAWHIAQLCLQFMPQQLAVTFIGQQAATEWRNMQPEEILSAYGCRVIGGSTTKPTSQAKQQQAVQIAQALGQFVQASPVALVVALSVFERAFDEVVVREEDWTMIRQSIEAQLGMGSAGAEGQQQGDDAMMQQVEQLIDSLPPEAKQALGQAIAEGVPVREAVARIVQAAQQQPQQG